MKVEMSYEDFERLRSNSMKWYAEGWHDQPDRFRVLGGGEVDWGYSWAHWFPDAASMILARAYLADIGELHQVLEDEAEGEPYLIVTHYGLETE
jgi:hypothetical protein